VDERSCRAVEVSELFADGEVNEDDLLAAGAAAGAARREMFDQVGKVGSCIEWAARYAAHPNPIHGANNVTWMAREPRVRAIQDTQPDEMPRFHLIPCTVTPRAGPEALVLGKWEVVEVEQAAATGAENAVQAALIRCIFGDPFRPAPDPTAWSGWRNGTVERLARAAYGERQLPGGTLEANRLAVLADALEEAGCIDAEALAHCRAPGPHVRGCWVVDRLLGKT
jgi:hypothetical protein